MGTYKIRQDICSLTPQADFDSESLNTYQKLNAEAEQAFAAPAFAYNNVLSA